MAYSVTILARRWICSSVAPASNITLAGAKVGATVPQETRAAVLASVAGTPES
ncbi:hypothetical protein [Kitasatospora viridis]|uniref:Uncharacterized protein n=1 Tax=Kitasatospora viridis TaxID=281105 RepID=A0A561S9V8_9ACTN|nr:hypothetical protein [Kitasatospora viridis]TWF71656.1 hypothetical protein FHX73_1827 [Kitasatospora viridis]